MKCMCYIATQTSYNVTVRGKTKSMGGKKIWTDIDKTKHMSDK